MKMNRFRNVALRVAPLLLLWLCLATGNAGVTAAASSEKHPGAPQGYLSSRDLPDSLALIPPPPPNGSTAFAADEEGYRAARALRNTPRSALAAADANLTFPEAPEAFSCAIGAPITEKEMPHLYVLMYRMRTDGGRTTAKAKDHYKRTRPFAAYKEASCTPDWDGRMIKSSSYPSSHATIGWAWALVLTEIAPERADAILARGYAYGQSRVVCGVHWQSDITEGRILGAALVARLHADPAFRAQVEAARADLVSARARNIKPARDCKAEAAALSFRAPKVP